MNRRMIVHTLGRMLQLEAVLLLAPLAVALLYREPFVPFLVTAAAAALTGVALALVRPRTHVIYARDGFVLVALSWLFYSAFGALPFVLPGGIPHYIDAFFETMSGFTTTGASILPDPAVLPHGMLFWRSFTHWIGGMGILVLCMAVVPSLSARSIHIMRAEMPGPIVGKLVPRARDTAKILYLIYIGMTLVQIALLCCGGMSLFDSAVYTFGTAGTGGFAPVASSCGGLSPFLQITITVFMVLFGVNFNLYYLLLIRRGKSVLKSAELWTYLGVIACATGAIAANIAPLCATAGQATRHAAFQVASVISTTGFSTTDFNLWPGFSKTILLLLMFCGACAGSTAGGLKVSRLVLLVRMLRRHLQKMTHPRAVGTVKLEGKVVGEETQRGVTNYFALYALLLGGILLLLSLEPFDLETNLSAAISCFNNVGPGLGAVGPAASYAGYSAFSKLVLSFAMLFGRLELYPVLFLFAPSSWMRK